ncbi:hypothetical protein L7F22_054830 [Adiantum nelumboides]|nr:hypothetical protein [Adiantum nelumboides]
MLRRRRLGGQGTMQRRDPVRNGTQVQLSRTFSQGQLVYTAPITIQNQNMHVEVDTGSSDLGKQGYEIYLFSDNDGQETGQRFDIDYLVGSASGPIILSNVSLADTTLPGQAFAVVDEVTNQQLGSMQASGVVGLALESNSIIQDVLVGDGGNANNSETNPSRTGSVLAGLWQGVPTSSRFFSLGLQRLPSDGGNGNSTLTFGDYDRNYVPVGRESAIQFSSAVPDDDGIVRKWKMILNDFFVKVNGTQVQIPLDTFGTASAILDTGSPLNLASVDFLNAMYGAVNVGPAADGSGGYYVDCSLPLEFTVSVGGSLVAIHPLDSSLKQDNSGSGSGGSSGCIGSFQALNRGSQSSTLPAQMILGAPFLRSVYSVYSCDANSVNASNQDCSSPRVGIYPPLQRQYVLPDCSERFQQGTGPRSSTWRRLSR